MSDRRALITGIGGQDGSYLAELLLGQGYEVFGIVRTGAGAGDYANLSAIRDDVRLVEADLLDQGSLEGALRSCAPHEVYNLASVSFVPASWDEPVLTAEFAAVGVDGDPRGDPGGRSGDPLLPGVVQRDLRRAAECPQSSDTPLAPLTPYGVAKSYAHFITRSYRRRYGLHASSGILYNHESPRRPLEFVTRKITHARPRASASASSRTCRSAISTRAATGATRPTTCAPCG